MPVLPEGVHCCMCNRVPDLYCQINNTNGEKGFMAWYCAYHLRQKLSQYAKIIPQNYPHYYPSKQVNSKGSEKL